MNCIFLDLEFSRSYNLYRYVKRNSISTDFFEVVEIGAVKTNENLEIIDTFRVYIKNNIFKRIGSRTTKITGITQSDLDGGFLFKEVFPFFEAWIKRGSKKYKIFCFGESDKDVLEKNCKYYRMSTTIYSEIIDFQKFLMEKCFISTFPGVKTLIDYFNLGESVSGKKYHSALGDSYALLEIYKEYKRNKNFLSELKSKYSSLDNIMKKRLTFEEAQMLDRRKYRLICPYCKSILSKKEIYYNMKNQFIYAKNTCETCKEEIIGVFKVFRLVENEKLVFKKPDYIEKDSFYFEKKKFIKIN